MKKLILVLVFLGVTFNCYPVSKDNFDVRQEDSELVMIKRIMKVLKMVESRGQSDAISPNGKYLGILQIGKVCVKEVNRLYGTNYVHKDAFDVTMSENIFILVMKAGIKYYKRLYGELPSEEVLVRMWNGGIYNGYKNPSTKGYYNTYLKFKKKYGEIPE